MPLDVQCARSCPDAVGFVQCVPVLLKCFKNERVSYVHVESLQR